MLRLLVAVGVIAALSLAAVAWRRPPRRLGRASLAAIGVREPAIVQFTSPICSTCKAAVPQLTEAADRAEVPFLQIDVAERPEIARDLGVRRVPTIAVTGRRGQVVGVWTSLTDEISEAAQRARTTVR
jgi:thiol-disulfide isomerase/thioredoxin